VSAVTGDQLIDAVNENDEPVGTVRRKNVFSERANFRVSHVLVFNSKGELLVQQLALTRSRHPGMWGSSVAAYVHSGESYEQAAKRRVYQELGVSASLQCLGKTSMNDSGTCKFISIFRMFADGPFKYDHGHIEHLQFFPLDEIKDILDNSKHSFTPTFLHVLSFCESRHFF
jgi:isopentenyl-diphosphate Delta-isomerase